MSSRADHSRHSTQILGAAGVALIVALCGLLVATYLKVFADVVPVTVVSDRAGLLLDKGARVRLAGVPIGEVRGTELRDDGRVDIDLALDEDEVDLVPADVVASIRGTTVFGSKFVDLRIPEGSAKEPIAAGAVIEADGVTVEVNDVFEHGVEVLGAVDPADLNATLTSASTALRGRGDQLGQFLVDWNAYFRRVEPHLGALDSVLELSPEVLGMYADVAPALIDTAHNLGRTSATLVANAGKFEALLTEAIGGVQSAEDFLLALEAPLLAFNDQWLPVTALGAEYSPEFTCVLKGLDKHRRLFGKFFGSEALNEHSFYGHVGFLPAQEAYDYAENLPKLVTGVGPACYPEATPEQPTVPRVLFDDGTRYVYSDADNDTPVGLGDDPVTLYDQMLMDWLGEGGRDALLEGLLR